MMGRYPGLRLADVSRGLLVGGLGVAAAVLLGSSGVSAGASTTTTKSTTFTSSGEQQQFTVPAGVTTLHVVAVGGSGGPSVCFFPPCGGAAAQATADIAVKPGEALYVEVGQIAVSAAGGWNGGGSGGGGSVSGHDGGGGGGASDVRTVAATTRDPSLDSGSLDSRLVVAGGGGGGSIENHGGAGGTQGSGFTPGGPGTTSGGGVGGSCGCTSPSQSGTNGALGIGGGGGIGTVGPSPCVDQNGGGGGGGGGGVYGGGGGAGGECNQSASGGGGGASGFAAAGVSNTSVSVDPMAVPSVTLSWAAPMPTPSPCTTSARPAIRVTTKRFTARGVAFTGTAAAHCPARVWTVRIAIARAEHGKCSFLVLPYHWTPFRSCRPTVYLPATGTYQWSFTLRMPFARGTYRVWPQAVDGHGVATKNTPAAHLTFRVIRHR